MTKTQFFNYLANGGKVRMITWHDMPVNDDSKLAGVRYADKVQSNAIRFNNGSWLYKADVNANDVKPVSAGGIVPAVSLGWAVYQIISD